MGLHLLTGRDHLSLNTVGFINHHMARYRPLRLAFDFRERMREHFYRILASLGALHDVQVLCRDLFTPAEIVMFMRRLHVAHMLTEGRTYADIRKALQVGTSTIKSVASRLARGGEGFTSIAKLLAEIGEELREEVRREIERIQDPLGREAVMRRFSRYYWPELLLRDAPRMIRHLKAGHGRKRDLKRKGRQPI